MNGEIEDYGEIKCRRANINCEKENQGLRGRGTRAQEESERLREKIKGAENAKGKIKVRRKQRRLLTQTLNMKMGGFL